MPRQKSGSKFIFVLLFLFLLGIGVLAGLWFWWDGSLKAVDSQSEEYQAIVIPKASGAQAIGQILKQNDLIKNDLAFRLYIKKQAWDTELKPGRYQFSQSQTLPEIAETIKDGVLQDFWVTIPEGKRREEVAKILADSFSQEGLNFSIPDFLAASKDLEGYLFPDTYLLPRTSTAEEVVSLMRNTFDQKITDEMKAQASNLGLSFQDVLILASLVEREAKFEVDRPKIAGVLLNRLDIDMALQIDATVQYAVGTASCQNKIGQECNWWPVITNTKYKSPYNTYENPGLPPGPICNPGLSVIEAVLNPDQHDYLYYLSEDSGTTHYSETIDEHNANIDKYLR